MLLIEFLGSLNQLNNLLVQLTSTRRMSQLPLRSHLSTKLNPYQVFPLSARNQSPVELNTLVLRYQVLQVFRFLQHTCLIEIPRHNFNTRKVPHSPINQRILPADFH